MMSKTKMGNSITDLNKHWPQKDTLNNNGSLTSLLKQGSILKQEEPATQRCVVKESNPNIFNSNSPTNHSKTLKQLEPVGVFWDFENCSVPKGKSAQAVVQKIRRVFFKEKREVEFMCVCDTSKEKKAVIEELNKAQVRPLHPEYIQCSKVA